MLQRQEVVEFIPQISAFSQFSTSQSSYQGMWRSWYVFERKPVLFFYLNVWKIFLQVNEI